MSPDHLSIDLNVKRRLNKLATARSINAASTWHDEFNIRPTDGMVYRLVAAASGGHTRKHLLLQLRAVNDRMQ